jgi:dTDP-4-dehydrorhamnose reductase
LHNPDDTTARSARDPTGIHRQCCGIHSRGRRGGAEPDAYAIDNADAPRVLARRQKKIGAAVIHYSTDYVFDGSKRTPYDESDSAAPINVYGKTKLAGEQAVCAAECSSSDLSHGVGLLSNRGRNFLPDDLTLGDRKEELRVVRDQFGTPTWSRDIAEATVKILAQLTSQGGSSRKFILARQRDLPP